MFRVQTGFSVFARVEFGYEARNKNDHDDGLWDQERVAARLRLSYLLFRAQRYKCSSKDKAL